MNASDSNITAISSGIGDYASWFLGAVIFRDVQTGSKYQFANDRWLAVEYSDGEVGLGS